MIVTELHDEIDGSDATQTIRFALDSVEYEIDVSGGLRTGSGVETLESLILPSRSAFQLINIASAHPS